MTQNVRNVIDIYAALDHSALSLLAPITSEEGYEAALEAVESLMERMGQDASHPLRPLFELLADHIEAYEDTDENKLPEATGADCLAYLMETHSLNQTDLAAATGIPQSNISAVLRGAREISKGMAHKFAAHFGLPVAVFLE